MEETTVEYDQHGRMKYNPDFHDRHGKEYTVKELIYIVTTYRRGKKREVALALGRTDATISNLVYNMRRDGRWEHYTKLSETI